MSRRPRRSLTPAELRAVAESVIEDDPARASDPGGEDVAIRHELSVHEIELEMQMEELGRTQEELAVALARYQELYELAPVGYVTLGPDGRVDACNQRAADLFGVEPGAMHGRALASFMDEPYADRLHRHLQRALTGGGKEVCDLDVYQARGGHKHLTAVRLHTVAAEVVRGEPSGWRSVLVDLSGIRATEARSQTIVETAVDAIVTSDEAGSIESFNAAAERLFGYAANEVIGRNVRELMPQPYRSEHDGYVRRYLETGEGRIIDRANREVVALRKDGGEVAVELGVGEFWDRGERKFVGVIHDISARERAQRDLRESEARLRQITEHIDDAFVIHDRAARRIVYASAAFERVVGHPAEEIVRRSFRPEWVDPRDRERFVAAYAGMLDGRPLDHEIRVIRAEGEARWLHLRTFPIRDASGEVYRDVGVVRDVTRERRLAEEMRQAQKMEAVGTLASSVAHDFNNVLMGILGCVKMAREAGTTRERAEALLDHAADAARHGGELAARLMAFARKRDAEPAPIELDRVVAGVAPLIERLITEQVHLDLRTEATGVTLLADPVQIEQILLNLAANARDAMPEGGTLTIATAVREGADLPPAGRSSAPTERSLILSVRDTGKGMDEATRARAFEPFFTTKELGQGTGLGLATVFAVTEQLRGEVRIESAPGEGTSFELTFPVATLAAPKASVPRYDRLQLRGRALVVDDDPLVRLTVCHYLEGLGLEVIEAADGGQALELAHGAPALDLLVTDVVMPTLRGPQLAIALRADRPALKVLLMTANPELVTEQEHAGALVLAKPFGRHELADRLAALFPSSSAGEASETPAAAEPVVAPRGAGVLVVEDEPSARLALRELLRDEGYEVMVAAEPSEALALLEARGTPLHLLLTDVRLPGMSCEAFVARVRALHPEVRVVHMSGCPRRRPAATRSSRSRSRSTRCSRSSRACSRADRGASERGRPWWRAGVTTSACRAARRCPSASRS